MKLHTNAVELSLKVKLIGSEYSTTRVWHFPLFIKKRLDIKENKLAEFNYKVSHTILPCGLNLIMWRNNETKKCNIYNICENSLHLLYHCEIANSCETQ